MRPNTPFETELGVCRNCENIAAFLSTRFCSMCGGRFERLKVREVIEYLDKDTGKIQKIN